VGVSGPIARIISAGSIECRAAEDPELRSGAEIQLAYRLEVNEYRGVERVQLNCQHFRLT